MPRWRHLRHRPLGSARQSVFPLRAKVRSGVAEPDADTAESTCSRKVVATQRHPTPPCRSRIGRVFLLIRNEPRKIGRLWPARYSCPMLDVFAPAVQILARSD